MWHTRVKEKVTARLGPDWKGKDIAKAVGICPVEVSAALRCTGDENCTARHAVRVQELIAKHVGLSTRQLFGSHDWRLVMLRTLRERIRQIKKAK